MLRRPPAARSPQRTGVLVRGMSRTYAVLGAGALGLTAALRLAQRGHHVTVLEREPLPGGLAAGFRVGGEDGPWLEKFYHHLFRSDRHAIGLIRELGLEPDLTWHRVPDGHPARRAALAAGLARHPPALPAAADGGPIPDGRRPCLPARAAVARAAGGADRRELDPPLDGACFIRRRLGPAPVGQVRGVSGDHRHALVLGPRPRPDPGAGLPARRLPAALPGLADAASATAARSHLGARSREIPTGWRRPGRPPPRRGRRRGAHGPLRPGDQHPGHPVDLPPHAGTAGRLSAPIRMGPGVRRPLPGPGAGPAVDERVLDERQRSGLPVHGPGGAHQHALARGIRRAPPGLPGQLPAHGRSAAQGVDGRSPRRVPARPRPRSTRRSSAPG